MRLPVLAVLLLAVLSPVTLASGAPDAGTVSRAVTLDAGVQPHDGIDRIYANFAAGYSTLDPALVAAQYTDEALYLSPDENLQRGRAAIERGFEGFFGSVRERGGKLGISFRIVARQISGDLGYDVGIFTLSTGKGEMQGKFVVATRKGADGVWRFEVDAYNGMPKP